MSSSGAAICYHMWCHVWQFGGVACRDLIVPRVTYWLCMCRLLVVSHVSICDATCHNLVVPPVSKMWCHMSQSGGATWQHMMVSYHHLRKPNRCHMTCYIMCHVTILVIMAKSSCRTLHEFYLHIWLCVGKDLYLQTFIYTSLHFLYV